MTHSTSSEVVGLINRARVSATAAAVLSLILAPVPAPLLALAVATGANKPPSQADAAVGGATGAAATSFGTEEVMPCSSLFVCAYFPMVKIIL